MTGRLVAFAAAFSMAQAPQTTFRSGVDVVQVDVSVMRGGAPVPGLTAANFRLTDNGVAQNVTSVTLDRLPLSVLLVLDVSTSVSGDKLTHLIDAGQMLVRSLRPEDRAALITFSEQVRVDVPMTDNLPAIASALAAMRGRGATSLDDAMHLALQLRPLDATRPVLLLFTDGRDTSSWLPPSAVIEEARRTGVVIQAVELHDTPMPSPVVDRLARAAGGRMWSATSSRDLRVLFTSALDDMRARYLLTFTPSGVKREGWHELKVALRNARGDVTARPAYFVAQPR